MEEADRIYSMLDERNMKVRLIYVTPEKVCLILSNSVFLCWAGYLPYLTLLSILDIFCFDVYLLVSSFLYATFAMSKKTSRNFI